MELLKVENLVTEFNTDYGKVKAVGGVSFYINEGEIVGFVGESGSGKSTIMLSVMQLLGDSGKGKHHTISGIVSFEGENLLDYDYKSSKMCKIRGGKISMIFQEPMTSLNPTMKIGDQLTEMLRLHLNLDKASAKAKAIELLDLVKIPNAAARFNDYPHNFSGGMRQRVMIAMAISCSPRIIIADEFTTALDVTTQAQVLTELRNLVKGLQKTSLIIVTHNLGLIARYSDRIYVLYAGKIVETGTTKQIFGDPRHPYTKGLLACVPRLDQSASDKRLYTIPGYPPDLLNLPQHCSFYERCEFADKECGQKKSPELKVVCEEHMAACYLCAEK
ncbi:MAG: ABC transporter ATP-binding protein [Parasporobacterium sp.]|nr:ABC transporter ATP-binding protein [Parasporobacterium sp.]